MIYLDNAATSWPKPASVIKAVNNSLVEFGANPGRSGHSMSVQTSEQVFECRRKAAELFNLPNVENVIFTSNCTHSINLLLRGALSPGDHVIHSSLDHNAIVRPLHQLAKSGVIVSTVKVNPDDEDATLRAFANNIGIRTKMVICTHASNVNGLQLPIRRIGELCHANRVLFAVDAAQSAGVLDIDMQKDNVDYLCLPGHKGIYGPMGTGMLLINNEKRLNSLILGGTGSLSAEPEQPAFLPDRFESGTVNVPGVCGMLAGMELLTELGLDTVRRHEFNLCTMLYDGLSDIEGITFYSPRPEESKTVPLISLNYRDMPSEELASALDREGVAVRAGLHCAPFAHRYMGTLKQGTVRFSPSIFTTKSEIEQCIAAVREIVKGLNGEEKKAETEEEVKAEAEQA
ncbi:MAG: aminotransferase class V-fold PLP-dependent enzyme [Oscillospiraceae bacterium]|jgi:cysteine desulfurase family protein|nr:aminotransferase class V-fold PLP-dependent enzyme [Oscillospiraceae bacterium]